MNFQRQLTGENGQPIRVLVLVQIYGASPKEETRLISRIQSSVELPKMGRPRARIDPALLDAVRNGSISEREGAKRAGVARNTFHAQARLKGEPVPC